MKICFKSIFAGSLLCLSAFFISCTNAIFNDVSDSPFTLVSDIRSMMQRADVEKMMFMGGSALYSPKDSNANQIAKNVIIATRIGKVEKMDLGGGQTGYRNSKKEYDLGYIAIDSVSKEEISFSYYRFSKDSNRAVAAGSFVLKEGQKVDLNGDGIPDVQYRKPDVGRQGYKTNMWLSFLCDVTAGDTATMFSIIPIQYERSAYPNGLLGINPDGQYIISKYEVGSSNRSIVSNIAYGDYVMDTENNVVERFIGEQRNGARSAARTIGDEELKTVDQFSDDSTPDTFEFKPQEFAGEFDIMQLFSMLPSNMVPPDFKSHTITDNTAYLNSLIRQPSFITQLVSANPGQAADEINTELARQPISSEMERVIFNRMALALIYPESCPAVNFLSNTLSGIFPWFYVDFGEVLQENSSDESDITARNALSAAWEKKLKDDYQSTFDKYLAEAREKHNDELKDKVEDYVEYEIKRDAIEKYFSTLTCFNLAPLIATLADVQWVKELIKNTKGGLEFGIAGGISFANSNPSVDLKLGIMLKMEIENSISWSIHSTSLFAGSSPAKLPVAEAAAKFAEKFPGNQFKENDVADFMDVIEKEELKDQGNKSWATDAASLIQKTDPVNGVRPSKDAKSIHKAFNPIKSIPFVITFDAQLDILFKAQAVYEAKNLTVGFVTFLIVDCKAGIDWGFRNNFWLFGKKIPVVSSFYADPYAAANVYKEFAGFAGPTAKNPDNYSITLGVKVTVTPVIEFRVGAGVGYNILGAGADVTVGAGADFFAPITFYLAGGYSFDNSLLIVREVGIDAGIGIHGDVQFCLDPPILRTKRWNYDLPGLKQEWVWQILKLRVENDKIVKNEGIKLKDNDAHGLMPQIF